MTTLIQQCPSCARVIHFTHPDTTLLQCSCGAVVNRLEGDVLVVKPFFVIQQPADSIQPGSEGQCEGKSFHVLGRFRCWFAESVFNYWTIVFDDGTLGMLAQGYGLYAILRQDVSVKNLSGNSLKGMNIGTRKSIYSNLEFVLEKRSACWKWEIEGEVYLPTPDASFCVYEFSAESGTHLMLFAFAPNLLQAYNVQYVSFASLQLQPIREGTPAGLSFDCSHCKKLIAVKTYPYAQSCACLYCGSHYVLKNGTNFQFTGDRNDTDIGPDMKLFSKGPVDGVTYEVIGYALKEEKNVDRAQWKEYTLFHKDEGYAFLSEYNGHWLLVKERGDAPVLKNNLISNFTFGVEDFTLYNEYQFDVVNARGEFPYNVFNPAGTSVKEFISPPEVWIREANGSDGIVWFRGSHLDSREVEKAFKFENGLPFRTGVGAVQPGGLVNPLRVVRAALIAVVVLIVVHILFGMSRENRVVLDNAYLFPDSTNTVTAVTEKFRLDKWRSNLRFDISAPVDNSWFELSATLVDAERGTEYSLSQGVEYYHGYTDGENWTEGSRDEEAFLTQLPAGTYFLQLQGLREGGSLMTVHDFHVTVTYDVNTDRNMWISILLLCIWPAVHYFRSIHFEKKRWDNSPFSPYRDHDED